MNPFMMSNMFFGPMGMSVSPMCGCGVSMPFYGMNDCLTFMNFPIFRNTSNDYLLNPMLAFYQSQQQMQCGMGNIYGNTMLPMFNNFPGMNMGPMSPWWNPSQRTETPEEKKKREEREAEEKKPENIEKKAKIDEYKSYFNKFKEMLDAETKKSADFKELESAFNAALKEDKIDDRVKKLEEVFQRLDKEILTKVALSDNSINSKLYEIGYNFPSNISKVNTGIEVKDLDNLISTLDLSDSVAVGAFGPTASKSNNYILHIISNWNDTHDSSEKGIIRGMAKYMPNNNTSQKQYKGGITGVADALIKHAEEFKNANGGAKALPKLCKQIETVRSKVDVIKKVNYTNGEKINKSTVTALADEFDKLYVMLRLIEADMMNQKVINKYGKRMNALIEGAIPEDIITKETRDDLKAEGFKNLPSADNLDKVDIKQNDLKIKKSSNFISADKKYEGKPQKLLDEYLADEENGVGVLTKVGDSNVYQTMGYNDKGSGVKYYTVSDNKLVECDLNGKVADNAQEVTASEIEKYDENLKSIKSMIDRDAIVPCRDDFQNAKLPYPVFESTAKNEYYAIIGDKLGKIKNCTGLKPNNSAHTIHASGTGKTLDKLTEADLEEFNPSDVKTKAEIEKDKEEKKQQSEKEQIQKVTTITFSSLKDAKTNKKLDEVSKAITGKDGQYDFKALKVNGYFYSNSTKRFYRYNENTNQLVYLKDVVEVNKNGYLKYKNGTYKKCKEVISDTPIESEQLVSTIQEYGKAFAKDVNGKSTDEEDSDAFRKLNTIITQEDPLYTVNFIKGYWEYGGFWSNKGICKQIATENGFAEGTSANIFNTKRHYIREFAKLILKVADISNIDRDSTEYTTLQKIANGSLIEDTACYDSGFGCFPKTSTENIKNTAIILDEIIKKVIKAYDENQS